MTAYCTVMTDLLMHVQELTYFYKIFRLLKTYFVIYNKSITGKLRVKKQKKVIIKKQERKEKSNYEKMKRSGKGMAKWKRAKAIAAVTMACCNGDDNTCMGSGGI